ncbi:MAG: hypothetical protein R2911_39055 [Caldilineaceae bacterium]
MTKISKGWPLWASAHQHSKSLLAAACHAGALGAKLSGGARGGNIIALVDDAAAEDVRRALLQAGARQVIVTRVE